MDLQRNSQLELALDLVRGTSTSIFLTGKAGSGKTTFLHCVKGDGGKRLVVVAPTGVAAINAGGMTIHSFFQLPFGLHLPVGQRKDENRRFSRKKLNLIRSLDMLVIDEISMVRADLLDAIDEVLRRFRMDSRPFGGVQLLMIGDLHQLPPVVKQEEWETLRRYYSTPYFFGSLALQKSNYVSIELKHIYRQTDAAFIELLNRVRDNCLDDQALQKINSRYIPNFRPAQQEAYITLTATNAVAQDINTKNLAQLVGKSDFYAARIEGEFPASSYPTEEKLEFKLGAQVMFIKNDLQPEKRYFNGKIGRIVQLDEQLIRVRCPDEASDIEVVPDVWQNVRYVLNETTKEIEEKILGTFTQVPLKLAWAITIHKSQGLTFERAIIDAQAAFAHGQVYVALSRCKSFEGIVLRSRLDLPSVKTDPVVKRFCVEAERNAPTASQIQQAKRQYQQGLLVELFDFQSIQQGFRQLCGVYQQNQNALSSEAYQQVSALSRLAQQLLSDIADKFRPQLLAFFDYEGFPEQNPALQDRLIKATCYFTEKLAGLLQETAAIPSAADNQAIAKNALVLLDKVRLGLFAKQATFEACRQGFSTAAYQRARVDAELEFRAQGSPYPDNDMKVPQGIAHPELYRLLLEYRRQMAEKHDLLPREVLTNASLRQLVQCLPTTQSNISRIHGIGSKRLQRYGTDVGDIVRGYCQANKISPDQMSRRGPSGPGQVINTKVLSFQMFQAGKTVEQIAKERNLALGTIQGHLASFVADKQLDVLRVLERDKLQDIERFWKANPAAKLSEAKSYFGDKYGYGELQLAFSQFQQDRRSDQLL